MTNLVSTCGEPVVVRCEVTPVNLRSEVSSLTAHLSDGTAMFVCHLIPQVDRVETDFLVGAPKSQISFLTEKALLGDMD